MKGASVRSVGPWLAGGVLLGAIAVLGAPTALTDPIGILWLASYAVAGTVLVVRRPTNPIGWLLLLIMLGFMGVTDLEPAEIAAMEAGTTPPGLALQIWIGAVSGTSLFSGYAALALILPTGHLPAGRWRAPAIVLLVVNAVMVILIAVAPQISVTDAGGVQTVPVPNPFAIAPGSSIWTMLPNKDLAFAPIVALLVVGVGTIIVRYRRSSGLVRLQLRWIVAAMSFTVLAVLAGFAILLIGGDQIGEAGWIPATLAFLTIPISIMIAVLRYRLLEIDRVISRTIGWAAATGVLVALFVGATLALQAALAGMTQGETIAVAGSTLVVAALFQPVRRWIQRRVDRQFDRSRYDRDLVISAFGSRLRDELDLGMLRHALIETSDEAVRPVAAGVWLRGSRDTR